MAGTLQLPARCRWGRCSSGRRSRWLSARALLCRSWCGDTGNHGEGEGEGEHSRKSTWHRNESSGVVHRVSPLAHLHTLRSAVRVCRRLLRAPRSASLSPGVDMWDHSQTIGKRGPPTVANERGTARHHQGGCPMYQVELSSSYFPAQDGGPDRLMTIGTMLRSSVALAPDRPALKELGYDGEVGRVWTYADLLARRRAARSCARLPPRGRCSCGGVREQRPRVGAARARLRARRGDPGDGQSRLPTTRAALRARAVTIRGRLLRR